jgi:peptidase E
MGGGGFSGGDPDPSPLDALVLALTGRERPRVCFLPTAGADDRSSVAQFYDTFLPRAQPTWLPLFQRRDRDLRAVLLEQDALYVGGGNTANMLAIWRVHGLDRILARAWEAGVVLAGTSAGANCWFEASTTDSFGGLAALGDGLALLPGSFSPHYDSEPLRRPTYQRLIAAGTLPNGYAADDGAAIVFRGRVPVEAVASRPGARAYRVERGPAGDVLETSLPTRYLG